MQKIYFLILIISLLFLFETTYGQLPPVQSSEDLVIDDRMFPSQSFGKITGASLSMAPWPQGKVYVSLDSVYSSGLKELFLKAFNEYERETRIDFIERTVQPDYIAVIQTLNKSSSYLGMIGGRQTLHIAVDASYGTILHELGHAIGLIHEHERSDRDEYINIFPENAIPTKRDVIERKFEDSINLTPYDFHSIMHYWKTVVSNNGLNTIEPKEKYIHLIDSMGQRKKLSTLDKISINKIYSFAPVAISPKNNQAFEVNNTINFNFVSTPSGYQYFLKIFSDSSRQNIVHDSRITHYSSYISELTMDVWVNFTAGDYFWRIETISEDTELKYSETNKFYMVNDLNYIVQQYPNPFNEYTTFEYLLNSSSEVTLEIFNTRGQKVTTLISDTQPQGLYLKVWNASDMASGLYLYRFRVNDKESMGKLHLVK